MIRFNTEIEDSISCLLEIMEEAALRKADRSNEISFPSRYNSDVKNSLKSFIKDQLYSLEGRAKHLKEINENKTKRGNG